MQHSEATVRYACRHCSIGKRVLPLLTWGCGVVEGGGGGCVTYKVSRRYYTKGHVNL